MQNFVTRRSLPLAVALLLLMFVTAGCSGSPSVLAPKSPGASQIAGLFWGVFAIAGVIFVVTEALLVFAVIRFRRRPGAGEPAQVHGNMRLEIAWTLAPAVILAGVFIATASTMATVTQEQPGALQVKVIGHQWWWEVQYPQAGITSATDIHVPVGQPIEVELSSVDVIHSFWVPEVGPKMDVIPGHRNVMRFTPTQEGTYRGQCAEFCGTQHTHMGLLVIAQPSDQYQAWVKQMQTKPTLPTAGPGEEGAETVLDGICAGCHTIDGTRAQGKTGPNLTHFASRRTIAALTIDNTPDNLGAWLSDTQAIKPGNAMPGKLGLTPEKIQQLVVFLDSLK